MEEREKLYTEYGAMDTTTKVLLGLVGAFFLVGAVASFVWWEVREPDVAVVPEETEMRGEIEPPVEQDEDVIPEERIMGIILSELFLTFEEIGANLEQTPVREEEIELLIQDVNTLLGYLGDVNILVKDTSVVVGDVERELTPELLLTFTTLREKCEKNILDRCGGLSDKILLPFLFKSEVVVEGLG